MKRWFRLGFQLVSLALFVLVLLWGGPEAWQQVAAGDRTFILLSLLLLGFASVVSAVRLQLVSRSVAGQDLAPWPRFYYLNMMTRALGLVVPRSLSTLGGKSVGLGALGISLRRSVWIVMMDNAFDVLLLGILAGPALLYLKQGGVTWQILVLSVALMLALAGATWWFTDAERLQPILTRLGRIPRLGSTLHLEPENIPDLLLPRGTALRALGLSILLNSALAACYFTIARAVGLPQPWPIFVAGFPITQLSLIIAVTPGGLGLVDAGWYGVLLLAGVPSQQALTFVVAQRAYIFVFVLVWAGFSALLSLAAGGGKYA